MLVILWNLIFICSYGFANTAPDVNLIKLIERRSILTYPCEANQSDVTFYFISRTQTDPVLITSRNSNLIDLTKPTKIIIHGWLQNFKRAWIQNMANEYLKTYDCNIIEVDWAKPAGMPYVYSAANVPIIANTIAQFIRNTNLSPETIHIIGHSLGAHVGGLTGQNVNASTGEVLARITGLDPAGPLFRDLTSEEKLSRTDAVIVDNVHTDAVILGYENPIGTLDIYINGGHRVQPGCKEDILSIFDIHFRREALCSQARAHTFFIESINTGKFQCHICQPVLGEYIYGNACINNGLVLAISAENVTKNTTGICFATTNNERPYLD